MKSAYNFRAIHDDGIVFDMHEHGIWIEYFHIFSPYPVRVIQNRLSQDGNYLKRSKQGIRRIRIGFQIEEENPVEFERLKSFIFSVFYTKKPFMIERDLTPDKHLFAVQESDFDITNITQTDGEFEIILSMLDPWQIGQTNTLNLTSDYQTYTIHGQTSTPWTTVTTFGTSAEQFTMESNDGLHVILNYNFIAGDVLIIDSKKREVRLNGDDLATSISMLTEWNKGEIKPGFVQLKASHETELTYSERYY